LTHDQQENDEQQLFQKSYVKVLNKLVVKRDNKQASLVASPKVSYAKQGKTIRYDIYIKVNPENG